MKFKILLIFLILFLSIGCVSAADNDNTTVSEDTQINIEDTIVDEDVGENFTGTFLNSNGNPIIGQHLSINLTRLSSGASKVYNLVTDYTGTFRIPIFLAKGEYTAQVSFDGITIGNTTYNPSNAGPVNIDVINMDQRTSSFLLAYGITKHVNRYRELSGLLTDNTGNSIAGQHIDVKFTRLSSGASKTYDIVTSYDGGFVMPINLALGIYAVNMTYHGTTTYAPSYRNVIVNVTDDPIYDMDW